MSGFERTGPEATSSRQTAEELGFAGTAVLQGKLITTSPGHTVQVSSREAVFAETVVRPSGNNLVVTIPMLAASQAGIKAGDRIAVVYSPVGDVILRKTQNESRDNETSQS